MWRSKTPICKTTVKQLKRKNCVTLSYLLDLALVDGMLEMVLLGGSRTYRSLIVILNSSKTSGILLQLSGSTILLK